MSLPPNFLDELRGRLSLSQVVGRKVTWDMRKSNQGKGDWWAPCPFHHEKTASFHVDDRKGFYYCFGCQAKGDVIGFVKESENVAFMEAVEILAREAGLQMPARDPGMQKKIDRQTRLAEVMEQAVQFYRLQLKTGAGTASREYLARRGLSEAALERWEIGFAPDGWQTTWEHLRAKGVAEDLILDTGLARTSQKTGNPYDFFRNRIMFPIRDTRGRAIAFGGRAMDPDDDRKYLNSPETALFDKGRNLFNLGPARAAAGKGQQLIVAEGYMDVIALAEAGFEGAVAPLGTAITEPQLELLWRIAHEPVMSLDGDKAGVKAALRVIDMALPLLAPGRSLRFALMPDGKDPDDLLRSDGPEAVARVLEAARPMVSLIWERAIEGRVFDSPERKAALEHDLKQVTGQIQDQSLRQHYERELRNQTWQLFQQQRRQKPRGKAPWRGAMIKEGPVHYTRASYLVTADEAAQEHMREAVILATLILTPAIVSEFDDGLLQMTCRDPEHARLRDILLRHDGEERALRAAVGEEALENLTRLRHVAISPCLRKPGDPDLARMTVAGEIAKLSAVRGLNAEIAEAMEDIEGFADEAVTWRLGEAAETHNRATRSQQEDRAEYDIGENGAPINRDERSALDALLAQISFDKPRT
ncbi:DNA primase [Marinibacterium profundimaris]|uniref:DNA primase n=1 Tax=Marinibacterium profundimaris TaxID=1679460 RepID=A0A225NCL4_9RHOB|nr:DNA primase [Marinibacterium profundimaris]OWU69033.1 DNA primase [Marinibacterium profundimaris]